MYLHGELTIFKKVYMVFSFHLASIMHLNSVNKCCTLLYSCNQGNTVLLLFHKGHLLAKTELAFSFSPSVFPKAFSFASVLYIQLCYCL